MLTKARTAVRSLLTPRKVVSSKWPTRSMRYPSDYNPKNNGILFLLSWVNVYLPGIGLGQMHPNAARHFRCMQFVLWGQTGGTNGGKQLTATSAADVFRSRDVQTTVWYQRYTRIYNVILTTTNSKIWQGVKWWLKRGMAQAATPGSSNHGNLLAIDAAVWTQLANGQFKALAVANDPIVWGWLFKNAPRYGFYWNVPSESWHLEFVMGDEVTQACLDAEAMIGPMPPGGV